MSSRLALVTAAVAMSLTVAAPAPASAGVFASLARMVVNKVVHNAEKAVVHAIKKELRGAGSKRGGRQVRVARY